MTPDREKEIREWVERWKDAPEWAEWCVIYDGYKTEWFVNNPANFMALEETYERRPDPAITDLLETLSELREMMHKKLSELAEGIHDHATKRPGLKAIDGHLMARYADIRDIIALVEKEES